MRLKQCMVDGKPGYKWGKQGVCYTYNPKKRESMKKAKQRAKDDGRAASCNEDKLGGIH
jgi:hypothetical protein